MTLRAGALTGLMNQSTAQVTDGSLRFDDSKEHHLNRTPSSAGNRRTWTYSCWVKWCQFSVSADILSASVDISNRVRIRLKNTQKFEVQFEENNSQIVLITSARFRDPAAWYHIVVAVDTTQATSTDRVKVYVNGIQITSFDTSQYPDQNYDTYVNGANSHAIGSTSWGVSPTSGYYLSEAYLIDGQALGPSYFGYTDPLTNTWRPKKFKPQATPNDGTTWSSDITGTPLGSTVGEAFDGSLSATGAQPDSLLTWTPSSTITAQNQIRLYIYQNGYTSQYGTFEQNGTNLATSIASQLGDGVAGWITLPSNTITQLKWSRDTGVGSWALRAVEVDGVTLIDGDTTNIGLNAFHLPFDGNSPIGQDKSGRGNDWTPVNFGGSNSLEKATGALPILNTDGGGNVARVGVRTDDYASSLVLALPLVGSSDDVSNQINSGSTTKTVAVTGATGSTTQSNLYGGSYYFNGPTDGASAATQYAIVSDSNSEFAFGTNDFTMEFWVWGTDWTGGSANKDQVIFGHDGSNYAGFYIPAGVFSYYTSSANIPSSNKPTLLDNKWYHVAVSRESGTSRVFLDGVLVGSGSDNTNHPTGSIILARNPSNNLNQFNGYIQDVRIYKGVAKYTSNFIPASTDPDILPDTPSGVSGGSKLTKITDGAVYFDGTGDYLSLADSADFDLAGNDFTIEAYVYHSDTNFASWEGIIAQWVDSSGSDRSFTLETVGNDLEFYYYDTSNNFVGPVQGGALFKNRWHHVAACRSGSTIYMFVDGVMYGSGTSINVNIKNSTNNLTVGGNVAGAGMWNGFISNARIINGTALYTSNFTPPTRTLTNVTNTKLLCCQSNTSANSAAVSPATFSNSGDVYSSNLSGAISGSPYDATQMFDGNLSTYTDHNAQNSTITWTQTLTGVTSLRVYIHGGNSTNTVTTVGGNGTQTDTISTDFGPGWHNIVLGTTGSTINSIAFTRGGSGNFLSIYAVEVNGTVLIDNFYGKAIARAGNAATTNFNPFNTDINTVRGQETGYATWNPLTRYAGAAYTLSDGNLKAIKSGGNVVGLLANFMVEYGDSGKYYWEADHNANPTYGQGIGWGDDEYFTYAYGTGFKKKLYYLNTSCTFSVHDVSNTTVGSSLESNFGKTLGIAFDLDANKMYFYVDGLLQATATGVWGTYFATTDRLFPCLYGNGTGNNGTVIANFGQKPFKFPPPAGFQPLNAANVRPETVIARPDQYVGVTTYTGNGSTQTISGMNFSPDFVWFKQRNSNRVHTLYDSVRGTTKYLQSNSTADEGTDTNSLTSFNSNGFSLGSMVEVNASGGTYVAWAWKAGGNSNTFNIDDVGYATASAAGLDGGTITPTGASVNTKSGFSIIKATMGSGTSSFSHGLGQKPAFIIVKNTATTSNWAITHKSLGTNMQDYYLIFSTAESTNSAGIWGGEPTSTTFSLGTGLQTASQAFVAYCWAEISGFSKFGTYSGNTLADGVFIELGFRPRLLMIKSINSLGDWIIWDTERDSYNVSKSLLYANTFGVEQDGITDRSPNVIIDILSNGFKCRETNNDYNASEPYIYAAWAEAPSFNLYGATSNAR